ncbi:MAG: hypothetical protein DRP68_00110 [Candidatus Omnitrophota bacterium]|nr:MAG: hypothetical protein DRP68_00110 [Candidatus Omnitrophota bacterium]
MDKRRNQYFDLLSLGMIVFIAILSLIRFNYLPQYIDAWWHLSCANGYIESGGWVGWSWWDYAPWGRPQVYPPFYHFLLVFLKKAGLSSLNAVRVTEIVILPFFFLVMWYVLRKIISPFFSFINLLTLSSFFSFYSSISCNVPASLGLIFGFFCWYFLKKKRWVSCALFLILCFYTHTGVFWIFFISLLFLLGLASYRSELIRIISGVVLGILPLLIHQLKYASYLRFSFTKEIYFLHFSIFLIGIGLFSLFINVRKDFGTLLFLGYLVGSIIVFVKYPFRFFSAQGAIGLALFCSLVCERFLNLIKGNLTKRIFIFTLAFFLFFSHATVDLEEGKPQINFFNSTYYNFLTGKPYALLEARFLFWPQYYYPIVDVIKKNTGPFQIISSNLKITAQIFSSLTQRPTSNSLLWEVKTNLPSEVIYKFAKVIIWIKPPSKKLNFLKNRYKWKNIYENDIAYVFKNPYVKLAVSPTPARLPFKSIYFFLSIFFFIFILDNVKMKKKL